MKIVINSDWGGFGLSRKAEILYKKLTSKPFRYDVERNDPILVEVVETLGNKANNSHSKLKVVEIPDDVDWVIQDYDGREWIAEKHRTWN